MKRLSIFVLCTPLLLGGCFSPQDVQSHVHAEADNDLAVDYFNTKPTTCVGNYMCDDVRNELHARDVIPPLDWPNIDANIVKIGMGPLSVLAAWGAPSSINSTTTAQGDQDQWVYLPCDTCKASYVYLTNGLVTAIQN